MIFPAIIFYSTIYRQGYDKEMLQSSTSEESGVRKHKLFVTKKEMIEPAEQKDVKLENMSDQMKVEELEAKSAINEEVNYEVYSPRIAEQCEREIPIFLEDRNYLKPSQISEYVQESQVKTLENC